MMSTVEEAGVTSTFSGLVNIEFANVSISGGMVAEKTKFVFGPVAVSGCV